MKENIVLVKGVMKSIFSQRKVTKIKDEKDLGVSNAVDSPEIESCGQPLFGTRQFLLIP